MFNEMQRLKSKAIKLCSLTRKYRFFSPISFRSFIKNVILCVLRVHLDLIEVHVRI